MTGQPCSLPCTHLPEDPVKESQGLWGLMVRAGKPIRGKVAEGSGTRQRGQERSRKQCRSSAASTWLDCGQLLK